MVTSLMKWLSIVCLILGLTMRSSVGYQIGMELLVCVAALAVVVQAFRMGKHLWVLGFALIATLFNPAVPVTLSSNMFLLANLASVGAFALSLAMLRAEPLLSIGGIMHPHRRIESL